MQALKSALGERLPRIVVAMLESAVLTLLGFTSRSRMEGKA
jgi:hypothetical protein